MKNLFVLLSLSALLYAPSCAQNDSDEQPPEAVSLAFQEKFPAAKKVRWEKESDEEWEAEFKVSGEEYSANFSSEGIWVETEYEIKEETIPANIKMILNENFSTYDIEEAEVAESPSGTSYELELETDGEEHDVVIDAQGQLTQTKVTEEDEE